MLCHCVYSNIYPLFRLTRPCATDVFKFSFVVMTHLASPIFRNHTTPNPPQVGTLHKYGYARAASAITSWNAVYSITCRLGSQEQIAISTSLHVLYLRVRDAFPIIILNLSNKFYVSTCWVNTSPLQQKAAASITFHFRICHVTYKIDLSTSTKNKGSVLLNWPGLLKIRIDGKCNISTCIGGTFWCFSSGEPIDFYVFVPFSSML